MAIRQSLGGPPLILLQHRAAREGSHPQRNQPTRSEATTGKERRLNLWGKPLALSVGILSSGTFHLLQCLIHSTFLARHLSVSLSPSFQRTGSTNKMLSLVRAGDILKTRCLVRTTQLPTSLSKQLRTLAGVCSNFESTDPKLAAGV